MRVDNAAAWPFDLAGGGAASSVRDDGVPRLAWRRRKRSKTGYAVWSGVLLAAAGVAWLQSDVVDTEW